jgi:hypothetical protein
MLEDFIKLVTRDNCLYHFTDAANITSIRQHGLLSYRRAMQSGVVIAHPGGNDWSHEADEYRDLDGYVHLSLTNNHPMLYHARKEGRIPNPVHLRFDPSILRRPGISISLDVSNKSGVEVHSLLDGLPFIDGEILFTHTQWSLKPFGDRRRAADKYEVLIPDAIATEFIRFPHGH